MDNSKKFLEVQRDFFGEIKKRVPANSSLVYAVSEALGLGLDGSYRRIRGSIVLNIKEIYTLCSRFGVSFDIMNSGAGMQQFDCVYSPVNSSVPEEYKEYILAVSQNFEKMRATEGSRIIQSAVDIPMFHLLSHNELRFFNLYTYANSVYGYKGKWDDFIKVMSTPEIMEYHQKISDDYHHIPSTEIWTENTLTPALQLINYYLGLYMFDNKDFPLLLCAQIMLIIDKIEQWVDLGCKGEPATPFQLYLSEMEPENAYTLFIAPESRNCIVKLFTINYLNVYDEAFCRETEDWLTKLTQRAVPLSGSSEKDRVRFFNAQRHKVHSLIQRIDAHFEV